ncbi:MAG: TonB-dependent receptor, partial [Tannerella sp.]|nr:TonB-dependent receptor [Tannerella sp.]
MRKLKITKRKVLLFWMITVPIFAWSQNISVTGIVSDRAGEGIVGVTVSVPGTTTGTSTDASGNYTLSVPANGKLNFSYIGYVTQTVDVGGRSTINITLSEDAVSLEEVVVVGYGTMKKSDLTGAVTSVSSDAITRSVPTTLDQVLQGRAAGVQVTQNSGLPGASSSIRIRGINSINASTEPIYVIDGVIINGGTSAYTNPLAAINPQDIVSMDILKDASATAIYGAQASNGVIIINTKRGKKGEAVINYNGYFGWEELPTRLDVLNLQQYATVSNLRADNGLQNPSSYFVRPDLLGPGTDWQDELFNQAMMQNHNLSISGGSDNITYNLSAGYSNQDGIAEGSGFKRLSLSGSFDSQVKEWAHAGVNFAVSNTNQKLTVSNQDLVLRAIGAGPNVPVRNNDGSYGMPEGQFTGGGTNPIAKALMFDNRNYNTGARANTFLELTPPGALDILKGLSYRTEFSFDVNFYNTYRFEPTYNLATWDYRDFNLRSDTKQYNIYYSWRNILTYDKLFGVNRVTAMLGQEMSKSTWENLQGSRQGLPVNGATDINLGDPTKAEATGYTGSSALLSYFGRLFYSYDDKYLLTATLRRDGSSKFAPINRWGWFPSFALGWRASQENFLRDHEIISNLKIRAGWGLVGNQNIPDNHAWLPVYGAKGSTWGTGLVPGNTPNEDLVWESTSSANIGFDLGLYRNRVNLIVDLYYKKTNNLLMQASLPTYIGVEPPSNSGLSLLPWVNLGSLENKGFELTLNTQNIVTKDFQWTSDIVFSLNRNKVLTLNTSTGQDVRDANGNYFGDQNSVISRSIVGEPIGQFFGYKVIGRYEKATDFYIVNDGGEIVRTPVYNNLPIDKGSGVWIGDLIYSDENADGVINEADRTFIGNPEPKFTYGFNNTFTFKNWDLGIQLVGVYGND